MCGVFGFVSYDDAGPNLDKLKAIAIVTQRRGQHAFGFAWIDSRGRLRCFKQTGRIGDHLGMLDMAADASMLIGHCRFATQGSPANNLNNHPHASDSGWIVHNGVIGRYGELVCRHDLQPVTECDSEMLGLLIEQADGNLLTRCVKAVRQVRNQPLVMLGLWSRPGRLVAVRGGNPLHIGAANGGERYYLGSLAEELPGTVKQVPDGVAWEFNRRKIVEKEV